jgi:hypothetical protein
MPGSDDALNRAVSLRGKPYVSLTNAFRFQTAFDDSCSCKREGQSWAQILRQAESMLDQRRGDVIVTAEKAEELSRPKIVQAQAPSPAKRAADRKASDAAETQEAAEQGAAAPTASGESSGIGPKSIETSPVVGTTEGPKSEVPAGNGGKRTIRAIAPNIIPIPQAKP